MFVIIFDLLHLNSLFIYLIEYSNYRIWFVDNEALSQSKIFHQKKFLMRMLCYWCDFYMH